MVMGTQRFDPKLLRPAPAARRACMDLRDFVRQVLEDRGPQMTLIGDADVFFHLDHMTEWLSILPASVYH
jgi:hypothetical protein